MVLRLCGHPPGAPSGVRAQSSDRASFPEIPPPSRKGKWSCSLRMRPDGRWRSSRARSAFDDRSLHSYRGARRIDCQAKRVRGTDRAKADLVAARARPRLVVHEEDPMKLSSLIGGGLLALATAVVVPGDRPRGGDQDLPGDGAGPRGDRLDDHRSEGEGEVADRARQGDQGAERREGRRQGHHRIHDVRQEHRVEGPEPKTQVAKTK